MLNDDPVLRRRFARLLRAITDGQEAGPAPDGSTDPPVLWDLIDARREPLLGLAECLERARPVGSLGLARLHLLITDWSGPLYDCACARSLDDAIWWVVDGLRTCPPHEWRCPVVMKVDPAHVAWTCSLCGAIATSDDMAAKPA